MRSLKDIACKTIVKNAIDVSHSSYYESIVFDFCKRHENYAECFCYIAIYQLKKKSIDCKYKGQLNDPTKFVHNFLCDETDLTTKYINNELNNAVKDIQIKNRTYYDDTHNDDETLKVIVPKLIRITLNDEIVGDQIWESGAIEYVFHPTNTCTRHVNTMRFDPIFKYDVLNPGIALVVLDDKDQREYKKVCKNLLNNPHHLTYGHMHRVYIFNTKLQWINSHESKYKKLSKVFNWFRTSPYYGRISELHFLLYQYDKRSRIDMIIRLFPAMYIKYE